MIPIQTQTNCYNQERRNKERNCQNKQMKLTLSNIIKFGKFKMTTHKLGQMSGLQLSDDVVLFCDKLIAVQTVRFFQPIHLHLMVDDD